MHLGHMLTALAGFGSLAVAAPASGDRDTMPAARGLRHKPRQAAALVQIIQQQSQSNAISQALSLATSQLTQLAEQQLIDQIQSQVALASQLQTIKDNIRINTLQARFPQVNTVLVTVTNVVDARDPANVNRRYLLSNLRVDNGFPNKQQVVMVTESQTMTISATPTSAAAGSASTLDIAALLSSAAAAQPSAGFSLPGFGSSLGSSAASQIIAQRLAVSRFNPAAPFSLLNSTQNFLLPYDTAAPTSNRVGLVIDDPANIIFSGQRGLLVESASTLQSDCASLLGLSNINVNGNGRGNANSILNSLTLFGSLQQALSAQLATISIGTRVATIPPSILLARPDLAAVLAGQQQQQQGTGAFSSTTTATTTVAAATATATAAAVAAAE